MPILSVSHPGPHTQYALSITVLPRPVIPSRSAQKQSHFMLPGPPLLGLSPTLVDQILLIDLGYMSAFYPGQGLTKIFICYILGMTAQGLIVGRRQKWVKMTDSLPRKAAYITSFRGWGENGQKSGEYGRFLLQKPWLSQVINPIPRNYPKYRRKNSRVSSTLLACFLLHIRVRTEKMMKNLTHKALTDMQSKTGHSRLVCRLYHYLKSHGISKQWAGRLSRVVEASHIISLGTL